ncbi:MAG: DUF1467 family protein [Cohaesibacter sp.]|nr:DUF1467 family protein [Cohaesibacter sp.]MCV6575415.1 DUF1467 family protein [Cohaesibacter sp.]MCV6602893.1 DUF1467 family protein [Cohaesibacter sp.]
MGLASGLAIYFIFWWVSLFLVLPFGVRTQAEEDDVRLGTIASAPAHSRIVWRMMITTLLATTFFATYYWAVEIKGLGLDDLTFFPMPESLR